MAILRAYLARVIVFDKTLYELPNSRTDRLSFTRPDFPLLVRRRHCLRPHPNSTPHGHGRGPRQFRP